MKSLGISSRLILAAAAGVMAALAFGPGPARAQNPFRVLDGPTPNAGQQRRMEMIVIDSNPGANGAYRAQAAVVITGVEICSIVPAGSCSSPIISYAGNSFSIDWGTDCMSPGQVVKIRIQSNVPVASGSGVWRNVAGSTVPGSLVLSSGCAALGVPMTSGAGLPLLLVLLGSAGLFVLRRVKAA